MTKIDLLPDPFKRGGGKFIDQVKVLVIGGKPMPGSGPGLLAKGGKAR